MLKDLLNSFLLPTELSAMLRLKYGGYTKPLHSAPLATLALTLNPIEFAYATLNCVSRSFAVVIQQLPAELRDPVCVFYLVLRGLDSVEDDMTYPNEAKVKLLTSFYQKLDEDGWSIEGVGDSADYRVLLAHFDKVIVVFKTLSVSHQRCISDIARRMGAGMAEYVYKTTSIDTTESYNLYCHYVAGLVGHGLSVIFSNSGLEDPQLQAEERLSNSMGLFLQKTNIIRDYLEDLDAGRTWWPEEIWSKYASDLSWFKHHPTDAKSLACLQHMVTDALAHVPDCIDYLMRLRNPQVFAFCAIPQVMAIATLCEVSGNCEVFMRNVKIRKGLGARIMLESHTLRQCNAWFRSFAMEMKSKMMIETPSNSAAPDNADVVPSRTAVLLERVIRLTEPSTSPLLPPIHSVNVLRVLNAFVWIAFLLATYYLLSRLRGRADDTDTSTVSIPFGIDGVAVVTAFASVGYLFGFFGVPYV